MNDLLLTIIAILAFLLGIAVLVTITINNVVNKVYRYYSRDYRLCFKKIKTIGDNLLWERRYANHTGIIYPRRRSRSGQTWEEWSENVYLAILKHNFEKIKQNKC